MTDSAVDAQDEIRRAAGLLSPLFLEPSDLPPSLGVADGVLVHRVSRVELPSSVREEVTWRQLDEQRAACTPSDLLQRERLETRPPRKIERNAERNEPWAGPGCSIELWRQSTDERSLDRLRLLGITVRASDVNLMRVTSEPIPERLISSIRVRRRSLRPLPVPHVDDPPTRRRIEVDVVSSHLRLPNRTHLLDADTEIAAHERQSRIDLRDDGDELQGPPIR